MMTRVWRMQHQPGWWVIWVICLHSHPGHSAGLMSDSDHLIAHILAISMPEPRGAPLLLCSHGELLCAYKGPESLGVGGSHHRRGWGRENISPRPGDLITLSVKGGNLGNFKFHVMWETIFWIRVMMILFNRQSHLSFCWRLRFFQSSTNKKILFFSGCIFFLF